MTDLAADYDRRHGGPERAAAAAREVVGLLDGATRVLDVGVGPGTVARRLPGRVVGVDPDAGRATAARRWLPVVRGDARGLPFRDGSFDAVVSVWSLHLVADTDAAVAEIARVLTPGGRWVTSVDKQNVDVRAGRATSRPMQGDRTPAVVAAAAHHGLALCGAASFACVHDDDGRFPATYPLLAFGAAVR